MTYQFPHEATYLARTKLSYVNLPGILADGKRERSARVHGFIAIHLGETCYLVFLRGGEAFQAARLRPSGRQQMGIAEIVALAAAEVERGEAGSIGYFGAPEPQLQAMLATLVQQPLSLEDGMDPRNPDRLFPALHERHFAGVVEICHAGDMHYLCFEDGSFVSGFFCGRDSALPPGQLVRSLFRGGGRDLSVSLYPALAELPAQALPGLIDLYRQLLEAATLELEVRTGRTAAIAALRRAQAVCLLAHPALAAFEISPAGEVTGAPLATPAQLTAGVAAWLVELLGDASLVVGIDPSKLLERSARDGRFVLQEQGFFAHLPWPVVL